MTKKRLLAVMICLFFSVPLLLAQGTIKDTGAIRGIVMDSEGNPLPGVTITITSPALMGTRSTQTSESGSFRLPLLPVGTYTLTAELQGFKTVKRENVFVTLAGTVTFNIEMEPAKLEEEITVIGVSPIVDVKTSSVAQYFKSDLIQNLPIARTLGTVVTLAPGVVSAASVKGGTAANTIYQVDGLYANDPDNAQLGVDVDFNIMEEVSVVTGGMPAEIGITSGGFVNVVTKSGGNKFSGLFQAFYNREPWSTVVIPEDQLRAMGLGKPAVDIFSYDLTGAFGGPIIKDRLWFFSNGRYGRIERRSGFVKWTAPTGVTYDEFNNKTWTWGALLKLTFQPRKNLRIVLNANARENYQNTRASGLYQPFDCHYKNNPWANYSGFGAATWIIDPNTYLEVRGGYLIVDAMLNLVRPELTNVAYNFDSYTGYYFGTHYRPNEWVGRPSYQASAHLSRFLDNVLGGDHELKAGFEVVTGACNWAAWKNEPIYWLWYNGNPYYYRGLYNLTVPHSVYGDGYIGFRVFGTTRENSTCKSRNIRYGGYFQDSWTIKNRLTVNIGLRYDLSDGWIPDVYKDRSGGIAYEVGQAYMLTKWGLNPYDEFRQDGVDDFIKWHVFTPRLGVTYDVFGNGKTALKLHLGRFSDWMYSSFFVSYHPIRFKQFDFYWWDLNNNKKPDAPPTDKYQLATAASPLVMLRDYWKDMVNKPLKATHNDQIMVGIDHELLPNFKVGLSYMYKKKYNIIDDVPREKATGKIWYSPDSGYWVPFTTTVPAIDQFPAAKVTMYYLKKTAPEILNVMANIPEAYRKYSALDITFEKRFSRGWQFGGSVTISKTWGNHPGDYGNIFGYAATGNTANWFVNNEGRLGEDRPLVIKLYGTFNLPLGILTSFYYNYYSGVPWQRGVSIVAPVAWANANDVDLIRGGSYGVNVETLGSRRYYTYQNCDFRLEKKFGISKFGAISAYLDIYNLFGTSYVSIVQSPGGTWRPVDNNTTVGTYSASGSYKRITGIVNLSRVFRLSVRYAF